MIPARTTEQPPREKQPERAGDGGLDHHRTADIDQRHALFALPHPDDRIHDLRQLGRNRAQQQRDDRRRYPEPRPQLLQLTDEELRGDEDDHERDHCLHGGGPAQRRVDRLAGS